MRTVSGSSVLNSVTVEMIESLRPCLSSLIATVEKNHSCRASRDGVEKFVGVVAVEDATQASGYRGVIVGTIRRSREAAQKHADAMLAEVVRILTTTPPPTTPTTDDAAQTSTSTAAQDAAEVETPRALWKVEADDLDRLPSLGAWSARPQVERAGCVVVVPTRDWRDGAASLVVRSVALNRRGPIMINDAPVEVVEVRDDCGRTTRLGSALHLACGIAAEARDAQGRAAAIVVVSADGQVRDLGRDADAAVRAYADALAACAHDRAASGVWWEPDAEPARRFWAALGATA